MKSKFAMRCLHCDTQLEADTRLLDHADCEGEAFLRTVYPDRQLDLDHREKGLFRFSNWLPNQRSLSGSGMPVTFRSQALAQTLRLKNLYITFSGYWPERDAHMRTASFKECEAYSVCASYPESDGEVLVVASAGNTARAFAHVCSQNRIPLVIVVPERNLAALWFDHVLDPCVHIVAAGGDADYFDAIHLAGLITECDGFFPEGGARNVARRDGMGTTVLSAATTIGRIPDYYFQAVGSGTGAIAAWEANQRLVADGRFGNHLMKLYTSQNHPFLLLKDSWESGKRELIPLDADAAREHVLQIWAPVLSNRKPPYGIKGGFFDALKATDGRVYGITNADAQQAAATFHELEGIDLDPAAAVATASLTRAARRQDIDPEATIMLNITGGGAQRIRRDMEIHQADAELVFHRNEINKMNVSQHLKSIIEEPRG